MSLLSAIRLWASLRPHEIEIDSRVRGEVLASTQGLPSATVDLSLESSESYDHPNYLDNQVELGGMAAYAIRLLVDEGWLISILPREVPGSAMEVSATHPESSKVQKVVAMQFYDAAIQLRPKCLVALENAI